MKIRPYAIFLIFVTMCFQNIFAAENEQKKFLVSLNMSRMSTSSFYNTKGTLVSRQEENFPDTEEPGDLLHTYLKYSIGLNCSYMPDSTFKFCLSLPFGFNSLEEKYVLDEDGTRYERKFDYSRNQFDWFSLSGKYNFLRGTFFSSAFLEARIPSGFDSNSELGEDEILSDGAFQLLVGPVFGYKFKNMELGLMALYNFRDEDFSNQALIHAELALTKIEASRFTFFLDYNKTLGDLDNVPEFDARRSILTEDFVNVGAEFQIIFENAFYFSVSYITKFYGKNSRNTGQMALAVGVPF